jgi:polyisoprenoid-binding protein YceI
LNPHSARTKITFTPNSQRQKIMKVFLLLFFILSFSSSVPAVTWQINKDHSEIFFQIPYLKVSDVTGRFTDFSGVVMFDDGGRPQRVSLKIKSSSLDTGNRLRDGHLKSEEFLRAKEHPEITFESEKFTEQKENQWSVSGGLALGGVVRPYTFDFTLSDPVKDTWNYETRFVRFKSKINRRDFGILWNKTLAQNEYLIGDEIRVWGTFQLQPAGHLTAGSKHMIPDTAYMRERERINRGESVPAQKTSASSPQVQTPLTAHKEFSPAVSNASTSTSPQNVMDIRDRLSWQISFAILGMLGFISVILMGLFSKQWIMRKYPGKYREGGKQGMITDVVTIIVTLLYVVTLWEVGWG